MNNSYKKAMDKITLSDEMKKSIIKNTSDAANIKRKRVYGISHIQKAAGLAACFTVCLLSYYAVTNYVHSPSNRALPEVSMSAPGSDNTADTEQNTEINQPTNEGITQPEQKEVRKNGAVNKKTAPAAPDGNAPEKSSAELPEIPDIDAPLPAAEKAAAAEESPISSAENQDGDAVQSKLAAPFDGNPMENIADTEQIEKELGYTVKKPGYIPEGYQFSDMCVIAGELVQIIYESENDTICYRTAKGNDNISGDYNIYTNIETVRINNADIIMKGNDNLYFNASWSVEGESFSIGSECGIEKETMEEIAESVK